MLQTKRRALSVQNSIIIVMLCFLTVLFFISAFFHLWVREEQKRIFLAKIFMWFILGGGIILGGITIWTGLHDFFNDRSETQTVVMLAVFAFILIGVGSNIVYELSIKRHMELLEMKNLRQQYPDSPWKWSRRWRSNRIEYSDKSELIFSYLIAAIIVAGVGLMFVFRTEEVLRRFHENRLDSLVILYVLVMGALFAVRFAVNSTVRWRNFKRASFVMSSFPAAIGGKLEGEIQTRSKHVPCEGFDLKLSCIEMDITFRKSFHSITETVLWESKKAVRIDDIRMGPFGIAFPVSFIIPSGTRETDSSSRDRRIQWVLTASGSGDDCCLTAVFKVPVFRVPKEHSVNRSLSPQS
jgi:hypothetical protein